jgi:SPP1 gp7 family putative phage head morphogenesis protein
MATIDKQKIDNLLKDIGLPVVVADKLTKTITTNFEIGIDDIEKLIDQNILNINPKTVEFLKEYSFDLVKNINNDLREKLSSTLSRGLMQGKSVTEMKGDIKKIFKTTETRARAIVRTETYRAYNMGRLEGAKASPVKLKKYWSAVIDNRTCPICKRLNRKYSKSKSINLDRKFKDNTSGWSGLSPVVHPNCRCRAVYVPVKNKEK